MTVSTIWTILDKKRKCSHIGALFIQNMQCKDGAGSVWVKEVRVSPIGVLASDQGHWNPFLGDGRCLWPGAHVAVTVCWPGLLTGPHYLRTSSQKESYQKNEAKSMWSWPEIMRKRVYFELCCPPKRHSTLEHRERLGPGSGLDWVSAGEAHSLPCASEALSVK